MGIVGSLTRPKVVSLDRRGNAIDTHAPDWLDILNDERLPYHWKVLKGVAQRIISLRTRDNLALLPSNVLPAVVLLQVCIVKLSHSHPPAPDYRRVQSVLQPHLGSWINGTLELNLMACVPDTFSMDFS
jgi:hypothetical protein